MIFETCFVDKDVHTYSLLIFAKSGVQVDQHEHMSGF